MLVEILRASFEPVARRFGFTRESCPTHTSLIEQGWLEWEFDHGAEYFVGVEDGGGAVSCVSMKVGSPHEAELKRLAVIPARQGNGFGRRMVEEVENQCRARRIGKLKLSIVAHHSELHEWYRWLGYSDTAIESYPHLPFKVQCMAKTIGDEGQGKNARQERGPVGNSR